MRLRKTFVLGMAVAGTIAAMLIIPGDIRPVVAQQGVAPQATFGLFLDPHVAPLLTIAHATSPASF